MNGDFRLTYIMAEHGSNVVAWSAVEERVAVVKPGANHGMPK